MTILSAQALPTITHIEAEYGLMGRVLCESLHWHDWTRWERVTGTIKERGRTREVTAQTRECIRCGYGEVKLLH